MPKVSRHDFYFELPLYEAVETSRLSEDLQDGDVDAYNPEGGFDTTYSVHARAIGDKWSGFSGYYAITLTCKRKGEDKLRYFIFQSSEFAMKLGQWPSLADIQFAKIGKRYDGSLSKQDLQEFKKAIGLASYGVGAGSFVYLRRIFEHLISETYAEHAPTLGLTSEEFLKKRMAEKVEALRAHLPSQLVEMKAAYGVLSKGVHELTEEECLQYFPVLKLSIELILDQKIEMDAKKRRDDAVKSQLAAISSGLGGKQSAAAEQSAGAA